MAGLGMQTGIVHAQTVAATATSVDNAALEQQLQVAKATLINLEMQNGMTPAAGDNQITPGTTAQPVTATSGLSASEVSYFNGVLSQLTSSLSELEATIVANPNMDSAQIASISATLGGMKTSLVSMTNEIAQDEQGSSVVAITSPAATTGTANAAATDAATSSKTAQQTVAAADSATPTGAQATSTAKNSIHVAAQMSSVWSFTKTNWPVILIILLVIAILMILFWPENESGTSVKSTTNADTKKTA